MHKNLRIFRERMQNLMEWENTFASAVETLDTSTAMGRFMIYIFFFFQADDGIRDVAVTGVQTCALPISPRSNMVVRLLAYSGRGPIRRPRAFARSPNTDRRDPNDGEKCGSHCRNGAGVLSRALMRSEERRVGKECRSRWSPYHLKKKQVK